MLWHKGLESTPISGINSDRIFGISFSQGIRSSDNVMSVIGVYLPYLDLLPFCLLMVKLCHFAYSSKTIFVRR